MFLKNYWYVGAWSSEVNDAPLARTVLDEPVVFFRRPSGTVAAIEDRCVHRLLPLSMGKVIGDIVQCHYHGLEFDGNGRCTKIPGQSHIPDDARVQAYPVVERYGWVWLFVGNPALANADDIPDFHWLEDANWGSKGTRFHVPCNWQRIVDNLLDPTHLAYVHGSTIGTASNAATDWLSEQTPDGVRVTRWTIDAPAPPTHMKAGRFTGNVDRWEIINWTAPSFVRIDVGSTATGTGAQDGHRQDGINMLNLNALTPETETTTHYFWAQAHNFAPHDAAVTEMLFQDIRTAFLEDADVLAEQQRMFALSPNRKTINIRADGAAIKARRMVDSLSGTEVGV